MAADTNPITALFKAVKTGSNIAKSAIDLAVKLKQSEILAALAEMTGQWAEAQLRAAEVQQELLQSKTRIVELEEALRTKEDLEFDKVEQAFLLKSDSSIEAGRFCGNGRL